MANSLLIATADYSTGRAQQTTISGINPAAKFDKLATFAAMTADLSKDSYVKAERIIKDDLSVQKPTIKGNNRWRIVTTANNASYYYDESGLWEATIPVAQVGSLQLRLTCNSYETATQIVDMQSTNNTDWKLNSASWAGDGSPQEWQKGMWYVTLNTPVNVTACDISFRIKVAETASYAGIDLPVIIHIVEE